MCTGIMILPVSIIEEGVKLNFSSDNMEIIFLEKKGEVGGWDKSGMLHG